MHPQGYQLVRTVKNRFTDIMSRARIRSYSDEDAEQVGRLIAETYLKFNLSFLTEKEAGPFLGPFRYAFSNSEVHMDSIARVIESEMVFVAEMDEELVGVLRGRRHRLGSLFVRESHHRMGIGRRLVSRFEMESLEKGVEVIRVASTLYAVPFYLAMGYKKSTGIRKGWSFEGSGLSIQPMRKVLQDRCFRAPLLPDA